jgi:hypothetical protein
MMDIQKEYYRPLHKHIFLNGLRESRNLTLRFCYMLRMIHIIDGTGWPDFESEEKTCKFKLQGSSLTYQLVSLILHALSFLSLAEMTQKDIKHWSWGDGTYMTLNKGRSWHWNVQKTSLPGDNLKIQPIIQKEWQKNLLLSLSIS